MSEVLLNITPRLSAVAVVAVALVSGCANRDSITVGAIPDDYRTNHPIVISEREKTVDVPVGASDRDLSQLQRAAVDGFIANYDRGAGSLVTVMVPYGSPNQAAASHVAAGLAKRMRAAGVPEGRIVQQPYAAAQYGDAAPIRLAYTEMAASVGQCGRWPDDMLDNPGNRHWANFGCSYQNNLAAQIANPADLLGPRKQTEIDTGRRSISIDDYRNRESVWTPNIDVNW